MKPARVKLAAFALSPQPVDAYTEARKCLLICLRNPVVGPP